MHIGALVWTLVKQRISAQVGGVLRHGDKEEGYIGDSGGGYRENGYGSRASSLSGVLVASVLSNLVGSLLLSLPTCSSGWCSLHLNRI